MSYSVSNEQISIFPVTELHESHPTACHLILIWIWTL